MIPTTTGSAVAAVITVAAARITICFWSDHWRAALRSCGARALNISASTETRPTTATAASRCSTRGRGSPSTATSALLGRTSTRLSVTQGCATLPGSAAEGIVRPKSRECRILRSLRPKEGQTIFFAEFVMCASGTFGSDAVADIFWIRNRLNLRRDLRARDHRKATLDRCDRSSCTGQRFSDLS